MLDSRPVADGEVALRTSKILALLGGAALLVAMTALPAAAKAPSNDKIGNAKAISSLPFSFREDTSRATTDPKDPADCVFSGQSPAATVWFSFVAPASTYYLFKTDSFDDYSDAVSVYKGSTTSAAISCFVDYGSQAYAEFPAVARSTYYVMVSGLEVGGRLSVSMEQVAAPPNDSFANATPVSSFYDTPVDFNQAKTEAQEPVPSCYDGTPHLVSAWYAVTPKKKTMVTAVSGYDVQVAAYTGSSLSSLTEIACDAENPYDSSVQFKGLAGTTYYIQLEGFTTGPSPVDILLGRGPGVAFTAVKAPGGGNSMEFREDVFDLSSSVSAVSWDYGDGQTRTGDGYVIHTYASPGKYTVTLHVTLADGRSRSSTRSVTVPGV
jgi:hypothetical protein